MSENKITMKIKPPEPSKIPQIDGMIALKKIEHYTYALTDEIGLGFSSHVYRGKNQHNNEPVAVKVIDLKKQDELSRQFMNEEINILETIKTRSPENLLTLFDVFKTKNNLYIITEFCEGKDMAKLLRQKKKFSEVQAQSILKQLMNAYRELYEISVVHRDLKLANIFVRKGIIKLADFGFAITSEKCQDKFDYNVGSPYYMPPQALKFNRYSFKSDVWSFGIIAFEMIYGHLPWKQKIQSILFEKITNTPVEQLFESDIPVTDNFKHFIISCLHIDYDKRASPEFIINYQWPLAQDYVDGVEPEGNQGYKPISVMRMPSLGNQPAMASQPFMNTNFQQSSKDVKQKVGAPVGQNFQRRDKSPGHRTQNRISYPSEHSERKIQQQVTREPQPKPASNNKLTDLFQNTDSPVNQARDYPTHHQPPQSQPQVQLTPAQASQLAQECILSQIYYCRFMSNLCDFLDMTPNIPEVNQLKSQLISKIIGKTEVLMRLREGDNLLQLQGFNYYRNTQKWSKIKDVIQIYFNKYREKYPGDVKSDSYDHVLFNVIRNLKNKMGSHFSLIEELTYFYQIKDLEKRYSLPHFAHNSKLQLLSSRKPTHQQASPSLYERLNHRLALLGF